MVSAVPERVGVVGAGLMGHGIAQVFALAGAAVTVYDPDISTRESVHERIAANLASLGEDDAALRRVTVVADMLDAAADAELVIEAAPENVELKRGIFAALEKAAPTDAILATNTSVIAISEVAAESRTPERIVGTHWWNPPYLVPLVEVIEAAGTGARTVSRTIELLQAAGKTAIHVRRDIPGFVGNRLQHAMWREALALIDAGVCDPETIDTVVRAGFGARLGAIGPVENADLVGLDLIEKIHAYLLPHLDCSTEPSIGLREHVARGELGAKSGRGYLQWSQGDSEAARDRMISTLRQQCTSEEA